MKTEHQDRVYADYRFNAGVNIVNIMCFWIGLNFIAFRTIVPVLISRLTNNSNIALSALSVIVSTGWLLPQIFTANWVRKTELKKSIPVKAGFFLERVPIFLLVPVILLAPSRPLLTAFLMLILIAWHHLGSGTIAVSWQELVAKIIPLEKRGSFYGIANLGGMGTGIIGAAISAWFLKQFPFPGGYVYCFASAAFFILVSWLFMMQIREQKDTDAGNAQKHISGKEYWGILADILRSDKNYRKYLLSQILASFGSMSLGFMAAYAANRWNLPESEAGIFTIAMLAAQAGGNLLFGLIGDKRGFRIVMVSGITAIIIGHVIAGAANAPYLFYAVFACLGLYYATQTIAGMMIVFEFTSAEKRPFYIGLNNTILGFFSGIAPVIGGILITLTEHQWLFIISGIFYCLSLFFLVLLVKDPRFTKQGK